MSADIEFIAPAGKTFSVQAYSATSGAAIGSPVAAVTDATTPTLYRATLSGSGIVFVVATATNLRVAGFANLDAPAANGKCAVYDTYTAAAGGVSLLEVDNTAIALGVYRRLAGASVALLEAPVEDSELDVVNSLDFSKSLDVATAADSLLVFTVRRCVDDADAALEVTSESGLLTVNGSAPDSALQGTVTRDSATAASVWIAAEIMSELTPGQYAAEIREIKADGKVGGVSELVLHVRRSAGRRLAA